MTPRPAVQAVIDELAHDPLRHVVLLKQLLTYPEHVRVHRMAGPQGTATLVLLDVSASPYDRQAYPEAAVAAFIASDHPALTAALLAHLPRGVGIVFKLSSKADLAPVAARFPVTRRTAFISFTVPGGVSPAPDVQLTAAPGTAAPGDEAFRLFETQGHDRAWLEPLLRSGKAFACVAGHDGETTTKTAAACIAFENFGPVWEVGGVVTVPAHRRQGLGAHVVRMALAELARRGLAPRYQVEEHNEASIGLARSVGLAPFLTITHYAHAC
ncbi:MAG: GNAT family N-acetyltransferase [Reyranella sp.]|nr:GNAT family N-acetyltransferase [Reyranella sp.]